MKTGNGISRCLMHASSRIAESTFAFTYSLLEIDKAHPRQQTKPNRKSIFAFYNVAPSLSLRAKKGLGRIG